MAGFIDNLKKSKKLFNTLIVGAVLLSSSASGYCQDQTPAEASKEDKTALYLKAVSSAQKQIQTTKTTMERAKTENWPATFINLADYNVRMAQQILVVDDKIQRTQADIKQLKERLSVLKKNYDTTVERVTSMGLTPSIAPLLQKRRRELIKLSLPRRSTARRQAEIRHINEEELHIGDLEEEIEKLDDKAIAERLTGMKVGSEKRAEIQSNIEKILLTGDELIDDVRVVNSQYTALLGNESYAERALRIEAKDFRDFININLLWSRSNQTFKQADITFLNTAALRFTNPELWTRAGDDLIRSLKRGWFWWGLICLLPLIWLIACLKKPKLVAAKQIESGSIVHTLGALGVAILYAGAIPLAIGLAGHLLEGVVGCHEFTRAISLSVSTFVRVLFYGWLTLEIVRPEGLGETHFGWSGPACHTVRKFAWWILILIAPLALVLTMINAGLSMPVRGSLGRILFIVEMAILAIISAQLFRSRSPIFTNPTPQGEKGLLLKSRGALLLFSIVAPISLLVVAFLGYYRSSVMLGNDLINIIALFGALIFLNAFLARWSRIARHHHQHRGEEREPNEKASSLEKTSKQIAILIRIAITVLALLGLYGILFDDIPIMKFLNTFILWSYYVGTEIKSTTLGNVATCVLISGFTILIVKNLSGILTILIFNRTKMNSGDQQALTLIIKYAASIIGLTLALGAIGIGWSKFQWLLAALTVGLGFGLQDIIANFASGIIILFERPISIGDIITINGTSGKVTKIRIRATTVTDWDRKEVIIPNKSFLTSDVVNWSLSNQLIRVVIPVGVAYGSDTKKTEDLLLKIAHENSLILNDPAPSVIFGNFGDSTLDFKLRVFALNGDRMTVIHQLHLTINDVFNKEGLEIAFPQQDVHIDTLKTLDVRVVQKDF